MPAMDDLSKNHKIYPIPGRLNLAISAGILILMSAILYSIRLANSWYHILGLALAYGFIMNIGYALMHEAVHNIFHRNRWINAVGGIVISIFFPIPFHLYRIGHLGHHRRNRSDDESLDLYFPGENRFLRTMLWYSILTGMHWFVLGSLNILIWIPYLYKLPMRRADRVYGALFESFNKKYLWLIRLEALAALALHTGFIYYLQIPVWNYIAVLFGFGFMWSTIQYLHHYDTSRDVRYGARNVRAFFFVDVLWLNFHYHLNHHVFPTVPWLYLPHVCQGDYFKQQNIYKIWLKQWRGPGLSEERIENKFAGKVIR